MLYCFHSLISTQTFWSMLTVLVVSYAEIKNGPLWWCNHFWQSLEEGAGKWCSKCALTTLVPAYWPKFATVKSQAAGYFFSPLFFFSFLFLPVSLARCVFFWCLVHGLPAHFSVSHCLSLSLSPCVSVCLSVCLCLRLSHLLDIEKILSSPLPCKIKFVHWFSIYSFIYV